jgi:X-X-X-Leu-X-X-Gly heptad repeat protein
VKRVAATVVEQARAGAEKLVEGAGDLYNRVT